MVSDKFLTTGFGDFELPWVWCRLYEQRFALEI